MVRTFGMFEEGPLSALELYDVTRLRLMIAGQLRIRLLVWVEVGTFSADSTDRQRASEGLLDAVNEPGGNLVLCAHNK